MAVKRIKYWCALASRNQRSQAPVGNDVFSFEKQVIFVHYRTKTPIS